MQELAVIVADENITALEFLATLRSAFDEGDRQKREYACHGLFVKCLKQFSVCEWKAFVKELEQLFSNDKRLLNIASASKLFMDYCNPDRQSGRRDCTLWLIRNHPQDPCHQHPPVCEIADEYFSEGAKAWEEAVASNLGNTDVLKNAASYFFRRDKRRCKKLYEECARIEPDNTFWRERLDALDRFHKGSLRNK